MKLSTFIRSNTDYSRSLFHAALSGARSAQESALDGKTVGTLVARSTIHSFGWVVVGAIAGAAAGARLRYKQQPKVDSTVPGALLGAAFGLSTGLLWNTRPLTQGVVRGAKKGVNAVRDANWLARNPINFG
jgi:hypothetical protein